MKGNAKAIWIFVLVLLSLNTFAMAQSADSSKSSSAVLVNINTANQADLEKLPGIGPSLAKRILEFRQKNGNFKTTADLVAVSGIGERKFEQLKNMITVK